MADLTISFSGRDFAAELERLTTLLRSELPEYTDWNHSDVGIVILRLLARETDQLNYYIDRVFAEGFLATAQFKQSLVDLGLLVGYLPTLASAAATRMRITRTAESGSDVIAIPRFSAFKRIDGLSYLTVAAVNIAADQQYVDVDAQQGELVTLALDAEDFAIVDWSKRPKYSLGKSVAAGTCEVWHGDPAQNWSNVDSFWRSIPMDRHFLLELNGDDDTVWLVLGDGVQGSGHPDQPLSVRFIRTAEAAGNCGHSRVTAVPETLNGLATATNTEIATGGAAAETIASLRRMIPCVVRTQRRAVILEDYEALLEYQAGVLHVQAVDRNSSPIWPHMYVSLFVVPDGGGPMPSLLKTQLLAECSIWGHLGTWRERYILSDATSVPTNIIARIGVMSGYAPDTVRSAVSDALLAVLAPDARGIGEPLAFAELHIAASAVNGVSWVEFDSPSNDVVVGTGEFVTPGTITVTAV